MVAGTSPPETLDALFSDFYLRAFADDAHAEETEAQALAAARLAGCPDGGDLLDVPCGFGRHAVPLARAGYKVVGVDRSQALIEEARRRGCGERWPKLARADYRDLPQADESFDAALNLFSSLGYLGDEEDTKALAEIRRVLKPGARLVLEIMPRDLLAARFTERDWSAVGSGRLLLEQRAFDPAGGVAQVTQTLIEPDGARESMTFSVRVYATTELLAMARAAGFAEARAYGDFAGGPAELGSRLVLVASA
jgi:ubiquinone/menaquinone biosynthesis C-methylase UbiE